MPYNLQFLLSFGMIHIFSSQTMTHWANALKSIPHSKPLLARYITKREMSEMRSGNL
jgi:hypothetical protein